MAIVEPELKLLGVLLQVLPGNVYVRSFDARLEEPPERFDAVNVNGRAFGYVLFNVRMQRGALHVVYDFGNNVATSFEHSHHDSLSFGPASTFAGVVAADHRFVYLYFVLQNPIAVNESHVLAYFVPHPPSRFVRDAKLPFKLLARDAVPRGGKEIDSVEPKLERRTGALKRSVYRWVNVMSAPLAGVGTLRLDTVPLRLALALWAFVTLPETNIEKVLQARLIRRELCKEAPDTHAFLALALESDLILLHRYVFRCDA